MHELNRKIFYSQMQSFMVCGSKNNENLSQIKYFIEIQNLNLKHIL